MVTSVTWIVDAGGDWSTAADWSSGALPNSSDAVTISTAEIQNITHDDSSEFDIIDKLTVGQDFFTLGGGGLDILTTASFADGYTQTGGTLTAGAVTITGAAELQGGGSEGSTAFSISGVTTLSGYLLGGSSSLAVTTTANQTGLVTLGDSTGVGAAITIAAGGVYNIANDVDLASGGASSLVTNAGTLAKGAGSGTSDVGVSITSTGTLSAASGDLQFSGSTNTISGNLSGAGQISFDGGAGAATSVTTFGTTVTATVSTLGVYGYATLDLSGNLAFAHVFDEVSNGYTTVNIGSHTFTIGGVSAELEGVNGAATLTGSGTFNNHSVLTLSNAVFGGALAIDNTGTMNQTGAVTLGDGSGDAPTFTNAAGGVYDFTSDSNLGENSATVTFTNAGTLEKTGIDSVSAIGLAVINTGTIDAQAGTFDFDQTLVNTGTISGAATFLVGGGGLATLNTGTVLSVADFVLNGTGSIALGATVVYAGVFDDTSDGYNSIGLGAHNLKLTGASNTVSGVNGDTDISGSGALENTGTLALGGAVVDGTSEIDNTGTINQNGQVTIGGGGGQVASIVNAAGANFNVSGANVNIGNGVAAASHFDNSGTVTTSSGLGSTTFATNFNNLTGGVLNIAGGVLQNTGVIVNAGTISGVQLALYNSGQLALNTGTQLSVDELDIYNTSSLILGTAISYAGTFNDDSDGYTTINLSDHTLILGGSDIEFDPGNGSDDITGSGTLKLTAAAQLEGGGSVTDIGGTASFDIEAKATVTGSLQVGDGSSNAANALVTTAGVYDITADNLTVGRGASAASTFTNDGLFEKTAGTGTDTISVGFVNNGTITVTSGTLEFIKGTLTNDGTINGVETTDSNGDILITAKTDAVKANSVAASPASDASASPSTLTSIQRLAQAMAAFSGADPGALTSAAAATSLGGHTALAAASPTCLGRHAALG